MEELLNLEGIDNGLEGAVSVLFDGGSNNDTRFLDGYNVANQERNVGRSTKSYVLPFEIVIPTENSPVLPKGYGAA